MHKVIAFGHVEEIRKWEKGFKTHADLFKKQTVISPILFGTSEDDQTIGILFEVSDLDRFYEVLGAKETAEAMAYDGVKKETIRHYLLDKEFSYK